MLKENEACTAFMEGLTLCPCVIVMLKVSARVSMS